MMSSPECMLKIAKNFVANNFFFHFIKNEFDGIIYKSKEILTE